MDFWCDNWIGTGPLILRNSIVPTSFPMLSQVLNNGSWELQEVQHELDNYLIQEILSSNVCLSDKPDKLIWKPSQMGNFSIKTAWGLIRSQGQPNDLAALIWKQPSPPSAQLLGWRILKNSLPMDSAFQNVGVSLASRCVLCYSEAESPSHLFIDCQYATVLWSKLSALLGFGSCYEEKNCLCHSP